MLPVFFLFFMIHLAVNEQITAFNDSHSLLAAELDGEQNDLCLDEARAHVMHGEVPALSASPGADIGQSSQLLRPKSKAA